MQGSHSPDECSFHGQQSKAHFHDQDPSAPLLDATTLCSAWAEVSSPGTLFWVDGVSSWITWIVSVKEETAEASARWLQGTCSPRDAIFTHRKVY